MRYRGVLTILALLLAVLIRAGSAADPRTRVFVSAEKSNDVTVIDAATRAVAGKVAVGRRPRGIAASPDGRVVYVANSDDNSVTAIDTDTLRVVTTFPAGLDLLKLAYAGLRVLGMSRDEANRRSVTIDWRSTLIVPIPSRALSYRPINVSGNEGLLIQGIENDGSGGSLVGGALMWSAGGETFAVAGAVSPEALLEIAQTLQ